MSETESKALNEARQEIDQLDSELLTILARRQKVAERVIEAKEAALTGIRDEARERALLTRRIGEGR